MDSDVSGQDSSSDGDFSFAFNDSNFSDRLLRIEIMCGPSDSRSDAEGCTSIADWARHRKSRGEDYKKESGDGDEDDTTNEPSCSVVVKELHISSPILAVKSRFFYKLFSNGLRESAQRDVTLRINESEEDVLMELLKFMYSNVVSFSTAPALLDVLIAADKFEVPSCMRYCSRLLCKIPMTLESALIYLELPSSVTMAKAVQHLTDVAKQFLIAGYKNITKFHEEVMSLPLVGIEAILSSDDLQMASEDAVYDFVLEWARAQYPLLEERREILGSRLALSIRFPFMTCRKLKEVLTCSDFEHEIASKLVLEALFFKAEAPHTQRSLAAEESASGNRSFIQRDYIYKPIQVFDFELSRPQCTVYLNLKREDCAGLLASGGSVYSQSFQLGGEEFFLTAHCNTMNPHISYFCFGLSLGGGMHEEGSSFVVEYEFSARSTELEKFVNKYKGNYTFPGGAIDGNPFMKQWTSFIEEDNAFFIDGVLHLRAELTLKR